jgi:hypothetical protein
MKEENNKAVEESANAYYNIDFNIENSAGMDTTQRKRKQEYNMRLLQIR